MQIYEQRTTYGRAPLAEEAFSQPDTGVYTPHGESSFEVGGAFARGMKESFATRGERANHTGIPNRMKQRFEADYGLTLDDVQVHYHSPEPQSLGAKAFTQGSQIHIAPGQERHLGHELGHVVQQKQGRVSSNGSIGDVAVNDNPALEREADRMGRGESVSGDGAWSTVGTPSQAQAPVQMAPDEEMEARRARGDMTRRAQQGRRPQAAVPQAATPPQAPQQAAPQAQGRRGMFDSMKRGFQRMKLQYQLERNKAKAEQIDRYNYAYDTLTGNRNNMITREGYHPTPELMASHSYELAKYQSENFVPMAGRMNHLANELQEFLAPENKQLDSYEARYDAPFSQTGRVPVTVLPDNLGNGLGVKLARWWAQRKNRRIEMPEVDRFYNFNYGGTQEKIHKRVSQASGDFEHLSSRENYVEYMQRRSAAEIAFQEEMAERERRRG